MLERETELIKQIIIESTINGREAIKLSDVIATSLPRGVKTFLTAEIINLIEKDFAQSGRLAQVTKNLGSTVVAERSLLRSLAMECVLQRDEYLKLVEDTVHFLENYLCRPQWTLNQLMFEKEEKIFFDTLVKKFESVVEYSYFGMLIERHARRNNLKEIEAEQFKALVLRIDEEVVKRHSQRELALLTKPIFDFLLFGDASMTRPIPLGAILLFFEDKKMARVKDYIDRISQIRSRTQISMNELIGILEDLYHVETTVKEDVQESEQEILRPIEQTIQPQAAEPSQSFVAESPETTRVEENTEGAEPATESSSPDQPLPIQEQPTIKVSELDTVELEKNVPPVEIPQPPVVNADELVAYAKEREALKFPSLLTFPPRSTEEVLQSKLDDIHEMLTKEQRDKFVNSIFKGDENYCFVFSTLLNNTKTWREAQPFLRDLFKMNTLDILSPDVVEFTDAMQARYHPELKKAQ